jgi:phage-related protein
MSKWLNNLDKASKGQAFQGFLKQFQSISGPALQAITAGIGNVAGSIGRLLTVMSGKDVAHTINIAFSAISGTIGGLTTTIKFLMNAWDGMGLAIDNVKSSLHSVAAAFDTVRHFFAGGGHDIAQDFDQIRHAVATVAHNIASAFDNVRHDIAAKFDGVKAAVVSKFNGAASWLGDKAHSIANAFDHVRHDIAAKFDGVKGFITGKFAGAGSWLVASGKAIMDGLLAGITSAWNKVATFLSSLAGKIKSLKGPLDYDRVMLYPHGQAIMGGLMAGMQSRVPALESQLRGITNDISGIAGNRAALAGGGGEIVNHIHVTLDGREIYSSIQKQAVSTQRRTGQTGLTKRTR